MKAKISRGNGFRGVLNYLLGPGDRQVPGRAEIVGGNISGREPRDLAAMFAVSRRQRPTVKNPVWHCSLSLPKGERLDSHQWDRLCGRHLENMGIDTAKHMWTAVRHSDTEFDHVHIVVCRIGLDATLWHGRNDVKIAIQSTQELEREFGLQVTAGLQSNPDNPKSSWYDINNKSRPGQPSLKARMQTILNHAMAHGSFEKFVRSCQAAGLALIPNVATTGRMNGFSFQLDGQIMKASNLGSRYKWAKLAGNLKFDSGTHTPLIQELASQTSAARDGGPEAKLKPSPVQTVSAAGIHVRKSRSIDLLFVRMDNGQYLWKNRKTLAFQDLGNEIRFERTPDVALKAALQLAREKGWMSVVANGPPEFCKRLWLQGQLQGIEVSGYQPTVADRLSVIEHKRDAGLRAANRSRDPLARRILLLQAHNDAAIAEHVVTGSGNVPAELAFRSENFRSWLNEIRSGNIPPELLAAMEGRSYAIKTALEVVQGMAAEPGHKLVQPHTNARWSEVRGAIEDISGEEPDTPSPIGRP
jgi:hypothetical protein